LSQFLDSCAERFYPCAFIFVAPLIKAFCADELISIICAVVLSSILVPRPRFTNWFLVFCLAKNNIERNRWRGWKESQGKRWRSLWMGSPRTETKVKI